MPLALRAGVIGASGVGKHHAKWLNALGCDVVAFVGTSADTVARAGQALHDLFGFTGRGYIGVPDMLDAEALDIVSICSPPQLHHDHLLLAVHQGCHVLCEKPLAWDPAKPLASLIAEGREMVAAAEIRGIVAAINTQYTAAAEPYLQLLRLAHAPVEPSCPTEFAMRMTSRGGKAEPSGEKIWMDLASHPISLLMALAGPGRIVPGSESCMMEGGQATATFTYARSVGGDVQARLDAVNVPEGPLGRRFGINGQMAEYDGRNDEDGVFAAYLKLGEHELKAVDFVQTSISRFVGAVRGEATPLATLQDGLINLEMQLNLLSVARG